MKLCSDNNIALLYVPAGCTDILQECDVVINSPFKRALKRAFRDFLHSEFETFLRENPDEADPATWNLKLTTKVLKENIIDFVNAAMEALKTPDMQATITRCFAKDGLFDDMRNEENTTRAVEQLLDELHLVPEGEEEDGEMDRVAVDAPADEFI